MPDLKFPRRRRDENGNWIYEPSNPVDQRQREIGWCKHVLANNWWNRFTAEERASAKQRLQELGITEEEAD
jgi:hypothetical protein